MAFGVRAVLARTHGRLVYALDDAYIHMAIAKNLARHGVWGCTPFHFSASSSSLLWTALLGLSYLVSGVHDVTPLVLNAALAAATLAVADRHLVTFGTQPVLRATTLVGLTVAFPLPGMVLLGMEHILHVLLTIAFAGMAVTRLTADDGDASSWGRRDWSLSVVAGLLAASRYEGLFLVGLVCLACAAFGHWRRAVGIFASALAPIVAFGALSVANGFLFFPNSLMLKAGGETASVWTVLLKPFGREDLMALLKGRGLETLLLAGLAAALVWAIAGRRMRRAQVLMPALLALMIALHVHFAFSSSFWVYRYDAYLLGFGIFACAVSMTGPRGRVVGALPAIAIAALVWGVSDVRGGLVSAQEVAAAGNTHLEHYMAAQFVQQYFPDQTVVINDLGAVSYFTDARILDMFGLGDMEPLTIRRRTGGYTKADVEAWTAPRRPALAMVQLGWAWVTPRVPDDWLEAAEVEVTPGGQVIGFFATTHDFDQRRKIAADVAGFYGPLANPLGYRVHLY